MSLSSQRLTRLSELLDEALPLSLEARRVWLESLPPDDMPLVQKLRDVLLTEDLDAGALRSFTQLPRLRADDGDDAAQTERRAGERLGAYELLQPLGAGGMAEVWLARRADGVFERQVALKLPRLGRVPVEMAERFARECQILATLECPGIARLYDAGIDARGVPYIAMEYVQGQPLNAWCDARELDASARVRLFLQVLDAVGQAHARQIVHRDLKPSNVLVTDRGEVRLLDFGVSSLLQSNTGPVSLTGAYGRALTPEYASPELLRGEPIDVRSDIYSLGVVLHELLTGARPGRRESTEGKSGELNDSLRAIVTKACAAAPVERYSDAASFAAALRRLDSKTGWTSIVEGIAPRYLLAGVAATAVLVAAASYYWMGRAADPAPAETTTAAVEQRAPTTIAVMPFADLSERHDHEYLSDGLAQELIDLLTKIPELQVTARASSFAFRDQAVQIADIARLLNVAHVLEGSVRTSGNRLKVSVQLVRASDGIAIWSETYDREMKDIFEIQENVAGSVVEALKLRLLSEHGVSSEQRTANVRAYEEYLIGRQYRDGASLERNEHAQAAFQRAVVLDPAFAPARAGIALAAGDIAFATMDGAPYDLALSEAERAIALAPRLTEGYVARAKVRMGRDWDFVGAKSDLDLAMSIDPNNIELLQAYASFLWVTGSVDRALEIQRRCVARNPLASKTWDWLGLMHMDVRDYPASRKAFARSAELSPYSDYRWLLMTLVELHSGSAEEALRLARSNPNADFRDYTVALAAHSAGQPDEAEAALQRLMSRAPDLAAAQIAVIYAWQGHVEKTFAWLDRAVALRDPGLFGIQYRPEFDKLRGDQRFERVVRLMHLPD